MEKHNNLSPPCCHFSSTLCTSIFSLSLVAQRLALYAVRLLPLFLSERAEKQKKKLRAPIVVPPSFVAVRRRHRRRR